MSLRKFSSGLKKKLKRRVAGGKPGGPGADASGETVDSTGSSPQPESHVTAKGEHDHPQPGNQDDADGGRIDSTDPTPRSDDSGFMPASGSQHDGGGSEVAIEGGEAGKWDLPPGLSMMDVIEIRPPSRGGSDVDWENADWGSVDQVDSSTSNPSISYSEGSEGTRATLYFTRCL